MRHHLCLLKEALVSTKSYMGTNANPCEKLWPKLFFEDQAPKHCVKLGFLNSSNVFSQPCSTLCLCLSLLPLEPICWHVIFPQNFTQPSHCHSNQWILIWWNVLTIKTSWLIEYFSIINLPRDYFTTAKYEQLRLLFTKMMAKQSSTPSRRTPYIMRTMYFGIFQ